MINIICTFVETFYNNLQQKELLMISLKKSLMLLAIAAVFCSCKNSNAEAQVENPVITIQSGKIQGVLVDNNQTIVFKGIPYAAAPVGELRWKKPQPAANWDTIRICNTFGPASIQPPHSDPNSFYTKEFYWNGDPEFSEDCLYLNVWTPVKAIADSKEKLPVAVWIHGGAYQNGWGHEVTMDGESWAKRDVILVTINYRLGILGFLCHPLLDKEGEGECGNYGTWDQAYALKWVKENIANFGGDVNNIMVFGQSAGAASVKNMVASPITRGLISKAIIQSGGGLGTFIPEGSKEKSMQLGKELMDMAGCSTLAQMRSIPSQELQGVKDKYMKEKKRFLMLTPTTGDNLLPKDFNQSVLDGEIADVPYMLGWNLNDMGDMSEPIAYFAETREKQSKHPTYVYHFLRQLPGDESGAFHSAELWYMFGTLKNSWRPFTEADYKLSEQMVDAWTNFAKYSNPNGNVSDNEWKPFTNTNKEIHKFDITK